MLRPFRNILLPILCALACLAAAGPATATTLPAGFAENTIAGAVPSGDTIDVTWAPDGRMFVADRDGRVYVHNPGAPASSLALVLDINDQVQFISNEDRGLMAIATDAEFATNHRLYLLYTVDASGTDSPGPKKSILTWVQVDPDNSVVGGPTPPTQHTILGSNQVAGDPSDPNGVCGTASNSNDCIPSEGKSHSVDEVRSAPDGTLWVGNGDGHDFTQFDPLAFNAANEQTFRGKLIHIDRDGQGLLVHPFCPSDTNLDHVCTKIYAKGIRQPFRFSLRPTGGIAFGEVGENSYEELNLSSGGEDFGWPCWEGPVKTPDHGYQGTTECTDVYNVGGTTLPAFSYKHRSDSTDCSSSTPKGNAVVGGPTYVGDQYPAGFRGTIFFGDYICSWLSRASVSGNAVTGFEVFSDDWRGVDIESAPDGNIVYVDPVSGEVREIVYLPGNHAPTVTASANPKTGVAPLTVHFSAAGSDPDGDPITYDWDFGDGSPHSTSPNPSHVYSTAQNWVATVTVADNRGMSTKAAVSVPVTKTAGGGTSSKPRLKLLSLKVRLAPHGILRGSFRSANSVRGLDVSLWKGRVGTLAAARSCRVWVRRFHQFKRRSCSQPHWMRARLHRRHNRYTWTVKLSGKPRRGTYTVVVRGRPRSSKLAPSTPRRLKLRVR
ncbi:MAG TPA: PQQ-dependent sugar dehydrogenase [Candidatus Dormibacteraeota bacterium]|nr:PQQ-dependent sugar dehydrogenase [Candidatus Dormibacteraeota bacterium]